MPIVLLVLGLLFLVAGIRGEHARLFALLQDDFTGPNNFIIWGLALFAIGAVGYYRPFKPVSNAFMVLIVLVLFLSNRGFFERFMEQVGATERPFSGRRESDNIEGSMRNPVNMVAGAATKLLGKIGVK